METFPAFFPLAGKRVVIAGAGAPAEVKARLFAGSPAEVVRLDGAAALDPAAYAGADLIFVASFDPAFRAAAARAARTANVPVNVVDAPEMSDFHTPAIVDRGQVVAAIGTAGASPLLASLLRAEVEARIPEGAGRVAALLGAHREAVRDALPDLPRRRAFLRSVLDGPAAGAAAAGDTVNASKLLLAAIADCGDETMGRVTFIAGINTPDLLSLRAIRALAVADVIVAHGAAAQARLANHGRRDAERIGEPADAQGLRALASNGRLVAVLAVTADLALAADLERMGVAVQSLSPAPPP
ncbi:MAG: NAD(P)-dependent oxidoreductase [Caulobacteraceae bacterium]